MSAFAERAAELVERAHLVAQGSANLPGLRRLLRHDIDPTRWVFITTVGGTFAAMQLLFIAGATQDDGIEVAEVLYETLGVWDPNGTAAYSDCGRFFNDYFDSYKDSPDYKDRLPFLIADGVGGCVIFNVLRRPPHEDETPAVRGVGVVLYNAFRDWWGRDLGAIR